MDNQFTQTIGYTNKSFHSLLHNLHSSVTNWSVSKNTDLLFLFVIQKYLFHLAGLTAFKQTNNPPSKALHDTENLKFVSVSHKIDHNSESIYPTDKIIISLDRG